MGLTGFNRARAAAAERVGESFDDVSYEKAIDILSQPESGESATKPDPVADTEETDSDSESTVTREEREAELKALNWEALKELLGSYELPTAKPKGVSWDDFSIPQILEHEGF